MIWIFLILGDRAANVDITWYHWPCNIDIAKNRFYMAARIDKIVISELAATDLELIPHMEQRSGLLPLSTIPLPYGRHKCVAFCVIVVHKNNGKKHVLGKWD